MGLTIIPEGKNNNRRACVHDIWKQGDPSRARINKGDWAPNHNFKSQKKFFKKSVDKGGEKIYYHLARRRKERRARGPTDEKKGRSKTFEKKLLTRSNQGGNILNCTHEEWGRVIFENWTGIKQRKTSIPKGINWRKSVLINELIQMESLILAQDERWRRA